ncbi:MAG: aspartate:alanine exchanger family transporter [Bacteroidia bacterium]
MRQLLIDNSILLLFVVASLGYFLGNIRIRGGSLGVAAVLFTGLAFGALDPAFNIPEVILLIGLSIFVYSIGLSSGPSFFHTYRTKGLSEFAFIVSVLIGTGVLAAALWSLFGFSAATVAGVYSGSTTNTAALAGVIDLINNTLTPEAASVSIEDVVVGYSFSYPMGVLGGMIAIVVLEKVFKIDYEAEKHSLRKEYPVDSELTEASVEVTNPDVTGITLRDLYKKRDWNFVFGRIFHNGETQLANWDVKLELGDVLMIVGTEEEIAKAISEIGVLSDSTLAYDRTLFDRRRIFVSNPNVAGRTIASLNIPEKYNAIITRIRRGDMDMLAKSNTVLEMGDRIRFIAKRDELKALSKYFGDSYRASSTINLFSFGLGIGLGLLLGSIEFSFGPSFSFQLGYAGGPLIVGLILGALRRTGPVLWTLPYSANVTLQQLGLMLLLAAIGVRSGNAFVQSISIEGLWIFIASTIISLLTAFLILIIGYKILKKPFTLLMGMVANQPAILDFANSRAGNNIPVFGFSLMFPIALISKIVIAQILFSILN